MWLTFSTIAGGIYFHEFENAHTFEWIALIVGMILNYFGLYHLVPTVSDQPILIINMDKPLKKKIDDDNDNDNRILNMESIDNDNSLSLDEQTPFLQSNRFKPTLN